jgi:hypothetical protein
MPSPYKGKGFSAPRSLKPARRGKKSRRLHGVNAITDVERSLLCRLGPELRRELDEVRNRARALSTILSQQLKPDSKSCARFPRPLSENRICGAN